jgi:hypothetical protein
MERPAIPRAPFRAPPTVAVKPLSASFPLPRAAPVRALAPVRATPTRNRGAA